MKSFLLLVITIMLTGSAFSQTEIEIERSSLSGITKFGVVVNIEKPLSLNEETLNVRVITERIKENFKDIPVTILSQRDLQKDFEQPYFYIHVNIMGHTDGIHPFSIEMRFYQPIKLTLKNDMQNLAATWHSGYVGMVSYDRLNEIADVMVEATNEFKDEYRSVN